MPDDEQIIRKRRAAADHAEWVAADADEGVARLEKKVERARADLSQAQDALAASRSEAKAAHRVAIEAKAAADAVTGADTKAAARTAAGKVG